MMLAEPWEKKMRGFLKGTVLVVASSIVVPALTALGVSFKLAVGVGAGLAIVGFVIQMCSAFVMKDRFEREEREKDIGHEKLLDRARELPPEAAVQLLLGLDI